MDNDKYIGRLLDNRYEILEVLGIGGMAVVYKARCHRLNRLVAIKILKDDYSQDEEFRRRFHAESHAVAMLSHPNIVSVYDVSTADDADYIVMELIDGITLKQYMEKKGVLNWKETLHFAIQIGKALEHAHSRGIIHRDIKPHNVMVLKNGSVKVTDFGIARVMSKSNTLTKEALGSVHYISPEQAKGGRVDNCSDLYSLGVVMYEMMTGRPPYDGESPVAVAIQHINGRAAMPSTVNPNMPGGLEQIIMKAMALAPVDRYPTATAMLHDLDEFRKNPAILFDHNPSDADMDAAIHIRPAPREEEAPVRTTAERVSGRNEPVRRETPPAQPPRRPSKYDKEIIRDEPERGSKVALISAILCAVVAVVAIGIFAWSILSGEQAAEMIPVPNLVGAYEEDLPDYTDLEIRVGERKHSDKYEKGQVIEQTPKADAQIAKGGRITVTISLGRLSTGKKMENLVGLEQKAAEDFLDGLELGLKFIVRTESSAAVEAGKVTRTEPSEGMELVNGQTVTLWISTGKETVLGTVPNVVNRTADMAIALLKASGFENYKLEDTESTLDRDVVVYQSVAAQSKVDVNTLIILHVSLGPSQGDGPVNPGIPEVDPDLVYKVVTVELPEIQELPENATVSIWLEEELLEEQPVAAGARSVQFEVSGKETVSFTVKFPDGTKQTVEVDFDE